MPKTLSFPGFGLPKVTPAEVKRFEAAANIKEALIQEKLALAEQYAALQEKYAALQEKLASVEQALGGKARALRADTRWSPSATDIQRGRSAMLRLFEQPQNLPLPEFARLAHKSRQQIYKDLAAKPRRLLALSVGPRRQRLPDWQLDPLRLRLTQEVLKRAADIDAWTVFQALSEPLDSLGDRSPVEAVSPGNLDAVVKAVYNALGVH